LTGTAGPAAAVSFLDPRFVRHAALWPSVEAKLPPGELAHDRSHIARVYRWALALAPEGGADPDLAGAAALAHDLAFVPKDSPERAQGGERSAALAPVALREAGYRDEEVAVVAEAVRTSSWSRGHAPTNPVGVVLQDADRLDAIGAVGLMRNLVCAQWMSRPERPGRLYHEADPFARSGRALDDRTHAIDHAYAKLLKLAAGMRLPGAKAEAARRHDFIEAFLRELADEIGVPGRAGAS
jgi:uncharacterized protein